MQTKKHFDSNRYINVVNCKMEVFNFKWELLDIYKNVKDNKLQLFIEI